MRLILECAGHPVEEIAAEPDTMRRLLTVLDKGQATAAGPGDQLWGSGGLLTLPRVEDATIPPLTVLLRPRSTPPEEARS